MASFSELMEACKGPIERYVHCKIANRADAEDILQEVFWAAYRNFGALRDSQAFLAWLMAIARTKCTDYYRKSARQQELALSARQEEHIAGGLHRQTRLPAVWETLADRSARDREILYLAYFAGMKNSEIAVQLGIPIGTDKGRLHSAREHFRTLYPYPPRGLKGAIPMKKLPAVLPSYTITPLPMRRFRCAGRRLWAGCSFPDWGRSSRGDFSSSPAESAQSTARWRSSAASRCTA